MIVLGHEHRRIERLCEAVRLRCPSPVEPAYNVLREIIRDVRKVKNERPDLEDLLIVRGKTDEWTPFYPENCAALLSALGHVLRPEDNQIRLYQNAHLQIHDIIYELVYGEEAEEES